jgi:hypothetical protein
MVGEVKHLLVARRRIPLLYSKMVQGGRADGMGWDGVRNVEKSDQLNNHPMDRNGVNFIVADKAQGTVLTLYGTEGNLMLKLGFPEKRNSTKSNDETSVRFGTHRSSIRLTRW